MGSRTFDGVWFAVFSHDHPPPHVHGQYGDVLVIVDLLFASQRGQMQWCRAMRNGTMFVMFWTWLRFIGRS